MMKTLLSFTILIVVALSQGSRTSVLAVTLEFLPASQMIGLGQSATVDVIISGLAAVGPPSVGVFDLDVTFNPAILSSTGVRFGDLLGKPVLGEALTTSSSARGVIDLAAVSLLSPEELNALQPARFSLASLDFSSLREGTSPLSFSQALMADAFGGILETTASGGIVNVAAPEPSSFFLVASGLVAAIVTTWLRIVRLGVKGSAHDDR
jgi:hypothetical protein